MKVRLIDLPEMHPGLLWDDILAATVALFDDRGVQEPYCLAVETENVPRQESGPMLLEIAPLGVSVSNVVKARRMYEAHRLVELAAISIAGLALFQAGRHRICDVALRGSAADYLVDEDNHLLEIAGRSRRSDFRMAWESRWRRLSERIGFGFYVCVVEFETPSGRLEFAT